MGFLCSQEGHLCPVVMSSSMAKGISYPFVASFPNVFLQ